MFQAYSAIFTTLDILSHIFPHSGIFLQNQRQSESGHHQKYSCILRYIQSLSLIQAYSYLAGLRYYSRAIHANFERYLSRFRYLWLIQARNISRIFTHIHKVTHIEACLPTLRLRHIKDPRITSSSNVKQCLLFKSGSSFKPLFLHFHFLIFVSKVNVEHFFLQDSISVIKITTTTAFYRRNSRDIQNPFKQLLWRILFRTMCNPSILKILAYSESQKRNNPLQHTAHATHAGTPPRPTHATHAKMPPTQAPRPGHSRQHVIHVSTPPTQPTLARMARYFSNS